MSLHIFESNKQKFVTGLFWQAIANPKNLKAEVKAISAKLEQDLFATRNSGVMQVGLCSTTDGAEKGAISLASVVSDALEKRSAPRSWMCAFILPSGDYAYVASRDGAFLPDGDIAGPRQLVINKMQEDNSVGSWDKVYAPMDFGFPGAEEIKMEDLLPSKKGKYNIGSKYRIKVIDQSVSKLYIVAGVAVMVALAVGYKVYIKYTEEKEVADIQAKATAMALKQAEEMKAKFGSTTIPPPPHPWLSMPDALLSTSSCTSALKGRTFNPGAWLLIEYTCDGAHLNYKWERNLTPISYLYHDIPEAVVDIDGTHATLIEPFNLSFDKNDEKLSSLTYGVFDLISTAQALNIDLKVTEMIVPAVVPVEGQPPAPPPEWKTYSYSFSSAQKPDMLVSALNRPGFRVSSVSYKPFNSAAAWSVNGLYFVSLK